MKTMNTLNKKSNSIAKQLESLTASEVKTVLSKVIEQYNAAHTVSLESKKETEHKTEKKQTAVKGIYQLKKPLVEQYSLTGDLIARHKDMSSAARQLGNACKMMAISNCIHGRQNTAYGYIWKYAKK